jgi:hypothetical protein
MTRTVRMSVVIMALAAVLALFAGMAATTAFAVTGDGSSIASATPLTSGVPLTLHLNNGDHSTGYYWLTVQVPAGNTLTADFTSGATVVGLKASLQLTYSPWFVNSSALSTSTCRLTFVSPATDRYNIWVPTSSTGTFTVSPSITAPINYALTTFTVPRSAKHNKSLSVSAKLWPGYKGSGTPVRFYFDRKVGKRWKSYGYIWGKITTTSTYSKFVASTKLKTKGTYRVRARFSDATHAAKYTAYKSLTIK